jgi:hypothetical protein
MGGLAALVVVQKPGVDDGLVGGFELLQPRSKPQPNHFDGNVVPALGNAQPYPLNGHFSGWQLQKIQTDLIAQCPPVAHGARG